MNSANIISWALGMSVDISVLLIFVLVVRKPVAKYFGARAGYVLWLLPLLGLFMPDIKLAPKIVEMPTTIITSYTSLKQEVVIAPLTQAQHSPDWTLNWGIYALALWLGISLVWLVFQLIAYGHSYRRALAHSKPVHADLYTRATLLADDIKLNRAPHIRICLEAGSPMVLGLVRPLIVLPEKFEVDFTRGEQDMVLAHEMMHIKRKDLWVGLVVLIYRAVNWPNPLVHFAAHKFRGDQEAACDASVLKLRSDDGKAQTIYLRALVKTAKTSEGV